jgi:superfamily II DNA or RNA helicase
MSFDLSAIVEDSKLHKWIREGDWIPMFDFATLNRAKPYSSEKLIRDLIIEKSENLQVTTICCNVSGTSVFPYRLYMRIEYLNGKWILLTDCTCPVGRLCKHAAALLILLARIFTNGGEQMISVMPNEIGNWLARVKKSVLERENPEAAKDAKVENRVLAYCIEDNRNGSGLCLVLRVATRRKNGNYSISESKASVDIHRTPKYLVDEDMPLVSAYHYFNKKNRNWGDPPLAGEGWQNLIEGAAALGRLFYGVEGDSSNKNYRYHYSMKHFPLKMSSDEWVFPDWTELGNGQMMPTLRSGRVNVIIIPTNPMMYLDEDENVVGKVQSEWGTDFLSVWSSGPIVSAAHLDAVAKKMEEVPGEKLPPPKVLQTVEHDASAPSAYFKIEKSLKGVLCGHLLVSYDAGAKMIPLNTKETIPYSQVIGGKCHVWKRNGTSECAFLNILAKMGFLPIEGRINEFQITEKVIGEWNVEVSESALVRQMLWVRFLESKAASKLRSEGWEIEAANDAGLTVHDIVDFFPEIESEADHGVNWFRFDVPLEINGRKLSLIPFIANAIRDGLPAADDPELPAFLLVPCEDPAEGLLRFPAKRLIEIVDQVRHLFHGRENADGPLRLDRLAAAGVADGLSIDGTETLRTLARLGKNLRTLTSLPAVKVPKKLKAELRGYQEEGFRWLQFLSENGLHGILADDMGLGKTVQTLAHLAAEREKKPGRPSLVIAPTSVVPNWAAETERFLPNLKTLVLQGKDRANLFGKIAKSDLVVTSYPLLSQDFDRLIKQDWHVLVLDEAQYIKNPKALTARNACKLNAAHRICLSGTPMENHLGELWSLMRFLMPGFLADEKTFNINLRKPIERDRSTEAQIALNRRVAPLILRRTKDAVAKDLPEKTEIIHGIDLHSKQTDLYESVRAAMDKRVRDAIHQKGLAKSHIIVLDALLKLRQICCHPKLLKMPAAQMVEDSAKLDFLTEELLPTLIEEGRRILLFSTFTSMLAIIEEHLILKRIPYLKITGQTTERASLVKRFQEGDVPVFLISLKAGGTGLNLTAADTVIHFDPWWNPAAENQATDRAHRIGQTKPVFVHKLVCRGSIEERMLELQKHKSGLVEALLSEETSKLRIDPETLGHLLAPIG